ncbi:MAG TPA: sigma-E factor negative regulatory protein [Rudaea sp.]|jgi:sigma-E factor negative regulatory protein RseA|nr:sigma-E factor negative regulatory protein [Rudaea sp.]
MSANYQEHLSALMDGELSRDETRFLLRRLDADIQLATSWSSYQIASQVMRKRFATPMRANFADAVMSAIAVEKTQAGRGGLLRWAGGGAIAAAVAVFALTATRPLSDSQPAQPAVAAVASATMLATPRVETQTASGTLPNFPAIDLTQPAGFDSNSSYSGGVISIPRYMRYRNDAAERLNDFGPYVLSTSPQTPARPEPETVPRQ